MNTFKISLITAFSFATTILDYNNKRHNSHNNYSNNNHVENKYINFGYSSPLKTLWKKGKMPSVTKGFYGDTLTLSNLSLEHIKAHSDGGRTVINNLVLASKQKNNARGNAPLQDYIDKEKAKEYLDQFKKVRLKDFNGQSYIRKIKETLHNMGIDI